MESDGLVAREIGARAEDVQTGLWRGNPSPQQRRTSWPGAGMFVKLVKWYRRRQTEKVQGGAACLAAVALDEGKASRAVFDKVGVEALAHLALNVGKHIFFDYRFNLLWRESALERQSTLRIKRTRNLRRPH
jgi:hypothetical protein